MKNKSLRQDAQRLLVNLQYAKSDTLGSMPPVTDEEVATYTRHPKNASRAVQFKRNQKLTLAIEGVENALLALADCPEGMDPEPEPFAVVPAPPPGPTLGVPPIDDNKDF